MKNAKQIHVHNRYAHVVIVTLPSESSSAGVVTTASIGKSLRRDCAVFYICTWSHACRELVRLTVADRLHTVVRRL